MRNGTDMGLKCGTDMGSNCGTDMGLKCGTDTRLKLNLKPISVPFRILTPNPFRSSF